MQAVELFDDFMAGAEEYEYLEEIGHGSFSEVHRAKHRTSGRVVALKHMYLQEEGQLPLHVERELALLSAVRHPNLVELVDLQRKPFAVALALEHCLLDLRTLLGRLGPARLDAAVAKALIQQLLAALAAVHAAGFMHRDVAPSNLLLSPSGHLKLADFGQSRLMPGGPARGSGAGAAAAAASTGAAAAADAAPGWTTPTVGTRWYKAPELMFGSRSYGPAVDLWSAGCVCTELLAGRPLFPGQSDIDQICRVSALLGSLDEERWPGVCELPDWGKLIFPPSPAGDLAAALPGAPPSAVELVSQLLQYNPQQRLSAAQALQSPYFRDEPSPASPETIAAVAAQALATRPVAPPPRERASWG